MLVCLVDGRKIVPYEATLINVSVGQSYSGCTCPVHDFQNITAEEFSSIVCGHEKSFEYTGLEIQNVSNNVVILKGVLQL